MEGWVLRTRKGKETRGSTELLQNLVRKKGPWAGTQLATPSGESVGSIFFVPWLRSALIDWRMGRLRAGVGSDGVVLAGLTLLFLSAGNPGNGLSAEHKIWLVIASFVLVSLSQNVFEYAKVRRQRVHSPAKAFRSLIHELRFWYHERWKSAGALAAASTVLIAAPEFVFWCLGGEAGDTSKVVGLKVCSGALNKQAVLDGAQWWRLSTVALVHLNVQHLVTNAIGLLSVLALLTRVWGAVIGITVLLVGIYAGALLSLAMSPVTSVGISGGILAMVAFVVVRALVESGSVVPSSIILGLSLGILELAALSIWVFPDYFDHFAHIGGLLAGALVAWRWRSDSRAWVLIFAVLAAFFVACTGLATHILITECV